MPRTRRSLLAATASLSVGLLGGCVGRNLPGDTDESPTQVPTTAGSSTTSTTPSSPTATPLPDRTVPFPEGPKARPERPESVTLETVRSYAKEHEYRYVYNQLWYDESTDVDLSCEVVEAREIDVGYKVVVSCTGSSNTGGEPKPNSTATSTMVHADYFTQVYTYLVDEDSLVRRRATEDEKSS